jgi:hypothetical protein
MGESMTSVLEKQTGEEKTVLSAKPESHGNPPLASGGSPPQVPGCLPQGYDDNSLLTLPQFAKWKQISLKTVRKRLAITAGLVRHSREDCRIHVKTHLAKVVKNYERI